MKRQTLILSVIVLVLLGGTAGLLSHQKSLQRLGEPGVTVVAAEIFDEEGNLAGTNTVALPETVLGYESRVMPIARLVLDWLPPDTTYAQRVYKGTNGLEMLVNVVLMGGDRTSIHKPEYCLVGSGWKDHQYLSTHIPVEKPEPYDLPVRRVIATRQATIRGTEYTQKGVFVYWFAAEDALTSEHGERMWTMAKTLVTEGVLQRWAYVSAFCICRPGMEEATYEEMTRVIAAMVPEFQRVDGSVLEARK